MMSTSDWHKSNHSIVESFFRGKNESLDDRDRRLHRLGEALSHTQFPIEVSLALQLYNDWVRSNYVVWPFPGGRLQQPIWVTNLFSIIEGFDEWYRLNDEKPSIDDLPSFEDMF